MNRARLSLRRRLTAVCLALMAVALLITDLDSYQREQATLVENLRAKMEMVAQMVAVNAVAGVELDESRQEVTDFLQSVTATMHLQACAVYLSTGERYAVAGEPTLVPATSSQPMDLGGDASASAPLMYKDGNAEPRVGCAFFGLACD